MKARTKKKLKNKKKVVFGRVVCLAVKKSMTLGEVVSKHPESAEVMARYGLHCIGCHVASWETVEQGARTHGLDGKEIDKMVSEINKAVGPGKAGKRAKAKKTRGK